jgi:transcriptional regulator with XRE-family HTH domain
MDKEVAHLYAKLLGKLRECGISQENLAKLIGINPATLSKKLNGHIDFRQSEIREITCRLGIPISKIPLYFFEQIDDTERND